MAFPSLAAGLCAATILAAPGLASDLVRITPLGSHDGALIFEDPDGTRILYEAGRTVRGPDDPRLGKIDVALLSHAHADHLGEAIQPAANAGTCAAPDISAKLAPLPTPSRS